VKEIIERKPPAVFNTLVGESSYAFMRALHQAATHGWPFDPHAELQHLRTGAQADRLVGLCRVYHLIAYFESIDSAENRAFVARWKARYGADSTLSVDALSTYVCVMLLARAIRRAGSADVAAVRRAAANHRYDSPQGPVWVDPDNNHCFLTPRLARSVPGCQFEIFWEADAPERPDPYLSNLDLTTIGTRQEKSNDTMTRRSTHLRVVK